MTSHRKSHRSPRRPGGWHWKDELDYGDMAEYLGLELWGHTPQGDLRVSEKGASQPTGAMTYKELGEAFRERFKVVPVEDPKGAGYVTIVPKSALGGNPSGKRSAGMMLKELARDPFVRQYIETALWAEVDDKEEPFDKNYGIEDLAPETFDKMVADAKAFEDANWNDIAGGDLERAGHDFWLTRNSHGAGFWDGDWPEPQATRLTDAAHAYGEVWLYIGDDGLIYSD